MNRTQLLSSDFYEQAAKYLSELRLAESNLIDRLNKYPQGKIHIIRRGRSGRAMYYVRRSPSERSGKYISVHDEKTLRIFLQKSYDDKLLKLLRFEAENLEKFLASTDKYPEQRRALYTEYPLNSRKLLKPIDMPDEVFAKEWLEIPFVTKGLTENTADFISENGEHVRSKSELAIANALYRYKIPYKYECPLILHGGKVIYPDFTVLNVRKRTVLYWEHRGMMDDRDYARYAVSRIKDYQKSQIYLGESLIVTEETLTQPLGTDEIHSVIKKYCM
ncbi:MAG: hypothetical protein ACOX78_10010 [Lachnospiraceae bacterium]|jgi:hypothetical protein